MPSSPQKTLSTTDNIDTSDNLDKPSWDTSLVTKPAYLVSLCRWLRKKESHRLLVERGVTLHKHLTVVVSVNHMDRDRHGLLPKGDFCKPTIVRFADNVLAGLPADYVQTRDNDKHRYFVNRDAVEKADAELLNDILSTIEDEDTCEELREECQGSGAKLLEILEASRATAANNASGNFGEKTLQDIDDWNSNEAAAYPAELNLYLAKTIASLHSFKVPERPIPPTVNSPLAKPTAPAVSESPKTSSNDGGVDSPMRRAPQREAPDLDESSPAAVQAEFTAAIEAASPALQQSPASAAPDAAAAASNLKPERDRKIWGTRLDRGDDIRRSLRSASAAGKAMLALSNALLVLSPWHGRANLAGLLAGELFCAHVRPEVWLAQACT